MNINFDENSASLKIEKNIYLRILQKAIDQTHKDFPQFESALTADDFETMQSISHRLKGDFGNLRIEELSSVAKEINEQTKSSRDKEKIAGLFEEFRTRFLELEKVVQQQ